ncbi:unnamed protein product [Ceratitis capitata]|uniref:(Mediterranean fruit fly) hypothetical protein n=1 Tax=Ceratitis capitata TaxID=7213 RepID=A0A811UP65_CERCA|nr:unnamed protein product [Ceratitis capitata]
MKKSISEKQYRDSISPLDIQQLRSSSRQSFNNSFDTFCVTSCDPHSMWQLITSNWWRFIHSSTPISLTQSINRIAAVAASAAAGIVTDTIADECI